MRNRPLVPAVDGRTRASQVNLSVLAFRKSARLGYINRGIRAMRIRRRLGHREDSRSEQHNPGSHVSSDHVQLALLRSGEFHAWCRLRPGKQVIEKGVTALFVVIPQRLEESREQREAEVASVREPRKADEFDAPGYQSLNCHDAPTTV